MSLYSSSAGDYLCWLGENGQYKPAAPWVEHFAAGFIGKVMHICAPSSLTTLEKSELPLGTFKNSSCTRAVLHLFLQSLTLGYN